MELDGKRALVTGAAVRLGRSLALGLAEAGCDVFVHYGTSETAARGVADEIERLGRRAVAGAGDLRDPEVPEELVDRASSALGGLDILVNCAALFLPGGLAETSREGYDDQLAVNLRAPFFLCRAFVEQLGGDRQGAILNVSDARALRNGSDYLAYRLTKVSLISLTRSLALELAPRVRVNCLALGAILPPPGASEEFLEAIARERIPLRAAGSPDDVCSSALHLLCGDFLTGVVLPVDGGEYL